VRERGHLETEKGGVMDAFLVRGSRENDLSRSTRRLIEELTVPEEKKKKRPLITRTWGGRKGR